MNAPLDLADTATQIRDWATTVAGVAHLATLVPSDREDLSAAAQSLRKISELLRSEHERGLVIPAEDAPDTEGSPA